VAALIEETRGRERLVPSSPRRCPNRQWGPDERHVWFARSGRGDRLRVRRIRRHLAHECVPRGWQRAGGWVALFVGALLGGLIGFPLGAWLMWPPIRTIEAFPLRFLAPADQIRVLGVKPSASCA
jgi:hypothetical protein